MTSPPRPPRSPITTIRHTTATRPQREFWAADEPNRLFIGGVGSGKTRAGCVEILRQPAGSTGMVLAPTYRMLQDATLRTFLELTKAAGVLTEYNKAEMRATLAGRRTVLFRSADNPDRLRGPNLGWFYLDEAAMMAAETWLIMIGRLRERPSRAWATSTPRGKNWLYSQFTQGGADYRIVKASSRTNTFLPASFVASLEKTYGELFAAQEIDGDFVDDQQAALIPAAWLDVAGSCPYVASGPRRMSIDLAEGHGGDPAGVFVRDDNGALHAEVSRSWTLEQTASKAALVAQRFGVTGHRVTFDATGLGSDFAHRLEAVGIVGARGYKGGSSGGSRYDILRTAAAWLMHQRLDPLDTPGRCPFHIPQPILLAVAEDLKALRYTVKNDKRIALEPKDELKAALGRSPTYADLMLMSWSYPNA